MNLLVLKDPRRSRRHAVYAPVGVAVLVANGYGEASKVGPDNLDRFVRLARYREVLALASIRRLVFGSVRTLTCKKRRKINLTLNIIIASLSLLVRNTESARNRKANRCGF